jgi:Zn-dependent peptidase ImmA (M78 family)
MTAIITTLRDGVPIRPLSYAEALRVAELQATKFLSGATEPPFPETAISRLPRVQVERIFPAPSAGATAWSHGRWLIVLNAADPRGRQRFSLGHEFKHVLDNPFIDVLYPETARMTSHERAEQICDYFAACLLMPRIWVTRAWTTGSQNPRTLARRFDVSLQAMRVRLEQIGLVEPEPRCLTGAA